MRGSTGHGAKLRATPRMFAAAAAIAAVTFLGIIAAHAHWLADYRTTAGEQRRLTLADGSEVLLDSATALDVDYSAGVRDVHLLSGQALFHVAHDPSRPFVVHDGALTATALGTVYAVHHGDDSSKVTVREGRVAVAREDGQRLTLGAGEAITASNERIVRTLVDTDAVLAWERGVLVFKQAPLAEVVAELNRHRRGHIIIASSRARDMPVSGAFRLSEIDSSLSSLAAVFPIRVTSIGGYLSVVR
ncbi:FecR family protein [Steroidobacter flavus]|uniref:FecR family protein n=1 Tax=Steroidobacter flavus TaxID=1842136 RepID=A0ABV8T6N1_9GAMM